MVCTGNTATRMQAAGFPIFIESIDAGHCSPVKCWISAGDEHPDTVRLSQSCAGKHIQDTPSLPHALPRLLPPSLTH